MQVALAELWRSWGIAPDGVAGHSMGEVTAAHIAGVLTLDDAARVICRRSALMRRLSGQGAMALVALPLEDTAEALRDYDGRLSVAVCNSPSATVISGESAAVAEFTAAMEAGGVFCRPVEVDVASHSPQVDGLRDDLLDALDGLAPRPAELPRVLDRCRRRR
jgi:acyl transferase domain-containing protein